MNCHDGSSRAMIVVGTRPEAIKLAPIVRALRADPGWRPIVVTTGQHGAVVDEVLAAFGIVADRRRDPWTHDGDLAALHGVLVDALAAEVRRCRPDVVVVQGDTASAFAGALAGFFAHVPVVDVEAGLRSGDLEAPFPEEANRRMITRVSTLHLAPTAGAAAALAAEGVTGDTVVVTGNPVIDALELLYPAATDRAPRAGRPRHDHRGAVPAVGRSGRRWRRRPCGQPLRRRARRATLRRRDDLVVPGRDAARRVHRGSRSADGPVR